MKTNELVVNAECGRMVEENRLCECPLAGVPSSRQHLW